MNDTNKLDDVIKAINQAPTPETCRYFGGSDMRSHDDMAAHYAYQAALMHGHIDMTSLNNQLLYLRDNGAVFNHERAFHKTLTLRNNKGDV